MTVAVPPAAGCPKPHRAVLLRKLPVSVWKDIVARQLRALHVDTIPGKLLVFGRVRDHLNSLRGRLPDHEALLVDDARGRVVTSSGGRLSGVQPPPDKLNGLRTAELFLGDPYWDAGLAKAALVLAVPIRQAADG